MTSTRWHLTYPEDLVAEPILWELSQQFGLHTNIRRANVEERLGWVIVEVRGDRIDEARQCLVDRGVQVADLD